VLGTAGVVALGWCSWWQVLAMLVFAGLANLGITAGYHRLLAHRAYEAHPVLEIILVLLGTASWQGPALKWASDHRRHHKFEDRDEDPYAIKEGFWHAHMGWLMDQKFVDLPIQAPDLSVRKFLVWQDRHYIVLATLIGFVLPALIGWSLGSFWTGFFLGGVLRSVLNQHSSFVINSFCHMFGSKPYSSLISARDNFILALMTHGEGYHNFHHTFQIDYRNGVKWYQWDPTKWTIWTLSTVGLTKKLKRISSAEILRAQLATQSLQLKAKGVSCEMLESLQKTIVQGQLRLKTLGEEYQKTKAQWAQASTDRIDELRSDMERTQEEVRHAMRLWQIEFRFACQRAMINY